MGEGEKAQKKDVQPEASFAGLLLMISSAALVHLGEVPDPVSGEKQPDLGQARWAIDTLGLLKEKTEGHLSAEEESLLDELLYDLRMRYLRAIGKVTS